MKKKLALLAALAMAMSMFTACGDDDSSSKAPADNTSSVVDDSSSEAEESEAPAESEEPSSAEDESSEPEEEGEQPRDISEVKGDLAHIDNASITFTADSDISYIEMFNEEVNGLHPGDEGYSSDEAIVNISLQEVGGVYMVELDEVLYAKDDDGNDVHKGYKIRFDLSKLFEGQEEKLDSIFTVYADLVAVAKDNVVYEDGSEALVPGWMGGAFGTNNNGTWNGNMTSIEMQEYVSEWTASETSCVPGVWGGDAMFSKDNETNYLTLMFWTGSHDVNYYVADLVFETEDGEIITLD